MSDTPVRWVVLKLGPPGLSSPERWRTIADVVRQRIKEGLRPLLVLPALPRMPDLLWNFLGDAAEGGDLRETVDAILEQHVELATGLGFGKQEAEALLNPDIQELWRLAVFAGSQRRRNEEAALSAEAMTIGELLLSRLAAAWLNRQGTPAGWLDARTVLRAADGGRPEGGGPPDVVCEPSPDESLARRLEALPRVVVTQGGIAGTGRGGGGTVRLGHGGADFSAACFAALLGAGRCARCEVWTDGPGLFTGDPSLLPSARLLRVLGHDEAQEILTAGGRGPHPRLIPPLRRHGIPLHIGWIDRPHLPGTGGTPGTVISAVGPVSGPQVKAIAARTGITLISMESVGMWREVGFLARVFEIFARHRLSIDSVSSSETNVTVTLDPDVNILDAGILRRLQKGLAAHCEARVVAPAASVSLVGRGIRAILHELGPVLEAFEERTVHLMTQSASDLNLTFVVDEDQSEKLVRQLHGLLFQHQPEGPVFGPTWEELRGGETERAAPAASWPGPWWEGRRDDLLALAAAESPLYVYDADTLDAAAHAVLSLPAVDRAFYSIKANNHPGVLGRFHALGLGFECVSAAELEHVRALFPDLPGERLLFTPNFAPREEYRRAFELGAYVTIDSLHPLRSWPEALAGREILLRLDPGHGRGHHAHVRTAGAQSKFGIAPDEVEEAAALAERCGARVVGLHAHAGSGIRIPEAWAETARFLAGAGRVFPHLRLLDLGGGLGVPERPGQQPLDFQTLGGTLRAFKRDHPRLEIWLEPGRFLVAQAGVLLARVMQVKRKGEITYVGVETGMNSLIRPALYGAYHPIYNLTRLDQPPSLVAHVVGPICETGDVLGRSRRLAPAVEGDVLLIANAGAYGRVMSSRYNLREPAAERLLLPPANPEAKP